MNTGFAPVLDILGLDVGVVDINKKTYDIQDIEYFSIVSNYATPVELMVDLLNISSSKEFVNAFIDKVINQTEIKLKIYNIRTSSSEKKVEITNEKTTLICNVNVTATVKEIQYTNEEGEKVILKRNDYVKVTPYSGELLWGLIDKLEITLEDDGNLPNLNGLARIEVKRTSNEGETTDSAWAVIVGGKFKTTLGGLFDDWFIEPTVTKNNTALITRCTTNLITENKVDIAVEYAKTWYGTQTNNNYRQQTEKFETKETKNSTTRVPATKSNLIFFTNQYTPIMIPTDKDTEYMERKNLNDARFSVEKDPYDYTWEAIGADVHEWFADLKADDVAYWLAPGGQLADFATVVGDARYRLSNEDELKNIRCVYTLANGWKNFWDDGSYYAYAMKFEAEKFTDDSHIYYNCLKDTGYAVGYLYETVSSQLVKGTGQWVDNTDFFLSLLKNSTGEYKAVKDIEEMKDTEKTKYEYNPNGKEIKYKTIYGNEARVGVLLENGAEMLYDLLGRSPNTQGEIYNGMIVAMNKYKDKVGGIVDWSDYENQFSDEWETITDEAA